MIKRVKQFQPEALMNLPRFRAFVEKSESEILRGISTVSVLHLIDQHGEEGIYGYLLLRELEVTTKHMLVIEEGTLYPQLKKLEKEGLVKSERKAVDGRQRKYYIITEEGSKIQNHLTGFFTKLVESMSELLEIKVQLSERDFLYCPNCANKIDLSDPDIKFCEVCGLNIEDLRKEEQ